MNGMIFMEVEKFVKARLGDEAWQEVERLAGVPSRLYVPVADYPDEEVVALLTALSARMTKSLPVILESLGEFIVPDFVKIFQCLIAPDWKTIDLIANTERTIHEVLRGAGTKTDPPELKCLRGSPQEVTVTYTSPRKLCALAKGIVRGVAKHYRERVIITEPSCMLKGGEACQLVITVA